jgi:hypothetical protein
VNQIRQRDGGTWMTFKPGALFAVNKIKTREVSSTGLKTIHISRNPRTDASSLTNYVCTRLHHDESAPRLIFTQRIHHGLVNWIYVIIQRE